MHAIFLPIDVEEYTLKGGEEAIELPKPDERGASRAASKRGHVYAAARARARNAQCAFAAQNLDDVALYGLEGDEQCGECGRVSSSKQHYA